MDDLISRKALIAEYDRVHIGPPGGARKLMEDAPAVNSLPCKIGDTVWAALTYYGKPCIRNCIVTEMDYLEDMTLAIAVRSATKNSQRVYWGVNAFSTFEECVAAVGGRSDG